VVFLLIEFPLRPQNICLFIFRIVIFCWTLLHTLDKLEVYLIFQKSIHMEIGWLIYVVLRRGINLVISMALGKGWAIGIFFFFYTSLNPVWLGAW
jgi:hypothetical protein